MTTTRYVTWGPVRGSTGVKHRTLRAAQKALRADQIGCAKQDGYSDRCIYSVAPDGAWTLVGGLVLDLPRDWNEGRP